MTLIVKIIVGLVLALLTAGFVLFIASVLLFGLTSFFKVRGPTLRESKKLLDAEAEWLRDTKNDTTKTKETESK